ncbi:MAG: hypothetical protein JNK04_04915, partial [Myxococcales bacterium]|nr:hypothetical protein [Myxococcales bacterium]
MDRAHPTPLVKGSAIREFALWYEARHGRAYVGEVIRRLPPDLHDHIWPERQGFGLVANDWYPTEVVHALLDTLASGRSDQEMSSLMREATAFTVRRLSRGLYQFLFRMVASPALYARHIQKAWSMLHTTGRRAISLDEPGIAISTIEDWPGHHRWLCELSMETMRAVFEAMGCMDLDLTRT